MSTPLRAFVRQRVGITLRLTVAVLSGASCSNEGPTDLVELGAPTAASVATASSPAPLFRQVSSGGFHTCGVSYDDKAYCWGWGGSVGDSGTQDRWTPVPVAGGLSFRQVSAGEYHACGVTTDGRAYCWGDALGSGQAVGSTFPVAVLTGLKFSQISAGSGHTCALSDPDRRAYCWGYNRFGQLGDGTTTDRLKPRAVAGGRTFRQVSAGRLRTCGVTPSYEAFCWGRNQYGELGDGTSSGLRLTPTPVVGGHAFTQIDAGGGLTSCGVTPDYRAFCWGYGGNGEIGDGNSTNRRAPRRVIGTLSFARVSAGAGHVCAETLNSLAYCWGADNYGQLGDDSYIYQNRPVAVSGGHKFAQVSSARGGTHVCAKTSTGVTYCWGGNISGELGDGTTTDRHVPVSVVGGT